MKSAPTQKNPPLSDKNGAITFDDLLVAVGKTGNRDAFIRLFEYFAPRVKSFLMKSGLTQEMADELAQETMLAVWQKAAQFDPLRAAASTWIFTIARNKRTDYFRKDSKTQTETIESVAPEDDQPLPDLALSLQEEERQLAEAIDALPEEQASMIRKAFLEEKTHADIAAETGLPLGTVKSRIRLALERLRYHMGSPQQEGTA
ncbi:MAG: sigma-70 family RNA polymerase sigma factor [Rhodospirillales bacterium]|nr:sigma-70 family RNA polymerase sigma factor [Rhodospirillales bacterium]MCB9996177.1 sigma-70 family RNA polymerase sigma factor [Rhodospirillales bacterium]